MLATVGAIVFALALAALFLLLGIALGGALH